MSEPLKVTRLDMTGQELVDAAVAIKRNRGLADHIGDALLVGYVEARGPNGVTLVLCSREPTLWERWLGI